MRLRTLSLSMVPVALGTAVAWQESGRISWLAAIVALIGAVAIQIASNLYNDVSDFERGGDGPDRLGPRRATATGLLTPDQVKRGALVCFGVASLAGLALIYIGGWPILLLGVASLVAAWGYTCGPWPIAYTPLGEMFVLAFFGLGAVSGTVWLHTHNVSGTAFEAGAAVGLFAAAVLLVNNHRDAAADTRVGRRTLAILAGPNATPWLYGALLTGPFVLLPLLDARLPHGHVWLAFGALPLAIVRVLRFFREPPGPAFNRILAQTAQVQLAFGLLLCIGMVL
jgi:1,4-dihydroxy-2-naphthoate octaprenyltransferase